MSRGWGGLSSGGSGMEEDGSSGRKFGAEPLRGSAKDSSQSTLGGEAVVGPLARAAGPARGVVGPTGTAASKMSKDVSSPITRQDGELLWRPPWTADTGSGVATRGGNS
jgi:hypothetical protein